MLDLCTWRCRIGLFYFKGRSVSLPAWPVSFKTRQVSEKSETVSVTAVFTFAAVSLLWLAIMNSFITNVFVSLWKVDISDITENNVKSSCVTMAWLDALEHDNKSDIAEGMSRSVLPLAISVILNITNMTFVLRRLLLSNDVEKNPGPFHNITPHDKDNDNVMDNIATTTKEDCITPDIAKQILSAIQQQNEQTSLIRNDLTTIKSDLQNVSKKCDEISERCDRLERENCKMSAAISDIDADVNRLYEESADRKSSTEKLSETIANLNEEVNKMNDEIDRLESFSRRDNLRIFGIPQSDPNENYDTCAKAVIQALNSGDDSKTWTEDDIIRAHRVGQGNPKPMIVKVRNWRDKLELLQNKQRREKLNDHGIRVVNDLTKRQAATVAQARRDGMSAYFIRGVMTVGPKRSTSRSYAEVVTSDAGTNETDKRVDPEANQRRQAATARGDSPRHVTLDTSRQPSSERGEINLARNASYVARGNDSVVKPRKGGGNARADRGDVNRGKPQQTGMKGFLSTRNTPVSDTRTLRSGSSSK